MTYVCWSLYFASFPYLLFLTIRQNLHGDDSGKVYQRFGPRLNLINSLRHLLIFQLNFSGAKNGKFRLDLRQQSPLTRCHFEMEQHAGNLSDND